MQREYRVWWLLYNKEREIRKYIYICMYTHTHTHIHTSANHYKKKQGKDNTENKEVGYL